MYCDQFKIICKWCSYNIWPLRWYPNLGSSVSFSNSSNCKNNDRWKWITLEYSLLLKLNVSDKDTMALCGAVCAVSIAMVLYLTDPLLACCFYLYFFSMFFVLLHDYTLCSTGSPYCKFIYCKFSLLQLHLYLTLLYSYSFKVLDFQCFIFRTSDYTMWLMVRKINLWCCFCMAFQSAGILGETKYRNFLKTTGSS